MKYFRKTLIGIALVAFMGLGAAYGVNQNRAGEPQDKSFCQICGDGFCARSCENERTCPRDCAPQPSR